jgi:hypothetical protein
VLFVAPADVAGPASDPRKDYRTRPGLHTSHVRPDCHDLARDLVAQREREVAASANVEPAIVAEVVVALPDVEIAVTYAAAKRSKDDLRAGRARVVGIDRLQRLSVLAELIAPHVARSPFEYRTAYGHGRSPRDGNIPGAVARRYRSGRLAWWWPA